MGVNKRKASARRSRTATGGRTPKKQKLTAQGDVTTSGKMLTAKDRNEGLQRVLDSLSKHDRATYKRIYNNAGKAKNGASPATIEHAIAPLREFLATRPKALRLHNQFAVIHRATSHQKVPLPSFPELEKEEEEEIADDLPSSPELEQEDEDEAIEETADPLPNHEVPAANTLTDKSSHQQAINVAAQPAVPTEVGSKSSDTAPPEQIDDQEHSTHDMAVAENDNGIETREKIAPSELGKLAALSYPFLAPVADSLPIFQDNLGASEDSTSQDSVGTSKNPTFQDERTFEDLVSEDESQTDENLTSGPDVDTPHRNNPVVDEGADATRGTPQDARSLSGEVDITNRHAFRLPHIRNMQHNHPGTKILRIVATAESGVVKRIVVQLDRSSVDDFTIDDPRIIAHLGLSHEKAGAGNLDTILWQTNLDASAPSWVLQPDVVTRPDGTLGGILTVPKHSYLAWLELRRERFPSSGPVMSEGLHLAKELGFHSYWDCMRELRDVYTLENGPQGSWYRNNRISWLGADPFAPAPAEASTAADGPGNKYKSKTIVPPNPPPSTPEVALQELPAHPYTMWLTRYGSEARMELPTYGECKPIAQELGFSPSAVRRMVMQHWSTEKGAVSGRWYKRNKMRILTGQYPVFLDAYERDQMTIWWGLLRGAEDDAGWRHWS